MLEERSVAFHLKLDVYELTIIRIRSVWLHVVQDLMSVMPLRRIQDTLLSMSTEDLRKAILVTVRADSNWPQGKIVHPVPQWCTSHDRKKVRQMSLLPGGEWLLILLHDGTLNICQPLDLDAPPILTVKIPRVERYSDNDIRIAGSPTITPLGAVSRILVSESYQYDDVLE
jgi:hypothetical protein